MPIHNSDIAAMFDETADILELQSANPFRIRAYRNAARVVGSWPKSIGEMVKSGNDLSELPGIGSDLAGKIGKIVTTGKFSVLSDLQKTIPKGLTELLRVPSLGPKRVGALRERLGISNISELAKAAKAHKIQKLRGFGEKTEQSILRELERQTAQPRRVKYPIAEEIANGIVSILKDQKEVRQIAVAGSFRRKRETVADLDILVTGPKPARIMDRALALEDIDRVVARGETRCTVLMKSGIQVDVRAVPPESYGAALLYFTGSKAHNIVLRTLAMKKGLKINEYGVFRGTKRIAGETEEEIYKLFDLPFIPPELREDRGEFTAAREGKLPRLIELQEIKGDLHSHTTATDGRLDLAVMAHAAEELGYAYLAITDHTKSTRVASGLSEKDLARQLKAIDRLNSKLRHLRILKSSEVDILENGSLDLSDDILKELDLTVCSIHSQFRLPKQKQTERIIRAMDNRYFNILGHPTGRLIDARPAYEVDLDRILLAAKQRGCFLEINAQPDRLDLNDVYCKLAHDTGVKVVISTDAHSDVDLGFMRYGVAQARRGWLEANDVLNTRSLSELLRLVRR